MADHITETQRAWAAGFLDGEGCFTLLKNSSKNQHPANRGVNISATQTKKEPLEKLQHILGGILKGPHSNGVRGTKLIYTWRISGAIEAKKAIEIVFPFLEGKEEDAALVYSYCLTVQNNSPKFVSEGTKIIRQQVIDRLNKLREA